MVPIPRSQMPHFRSAARSLYALVPVVPEIPLMFQARQPFVLGQEAMQAPVLAEQPELFAQAAARQAVRVAKEDRLLAAAEVVVEEARQVRTAQAQSEAAAEQSILLAAVAEEAMVAAAPERLQQVSTAQTAATIPAPPVEALADLAWEAMAQAEVAAQAAQVLLLAAALFPAAQVLGGPSGPKLAAVVAEVEAEETPAQLAAAIMEVMAALPLLTPVVVAEAEEVVATQDVLAEPVQVELTV